MYVASKKFTQTVVVNNFIHPIIASFPPPIHSYGVRVSIFVVPKKPTQIDLKSRENLTCF